MHISETRSYQIRQAQLRGTLPLGELVYQCFRWTGIHWAYTKLRPGCGCQQRRSRLNSIRLRSPIFLVK
jgi:hypothetical protein